MHVQLRKMVTGIAFNKLRIDTIAKWDNLGYPIFFIPFV